MNESQLKTVAQLRAFLEGTLEVKFQPIRNDVERYGLIAAVLGRFAYRRLVRADKGILMRYLARITDYSRAQLRRLLGRHLKGEPLAKRYRAPAAGFARKFTTADVKLLAQTDALHNTLSGPATKCLMQRAYSVYGDTRYTRLATLSVAHLYNLRHQAGYQAIRAHWTKTRGYAVPIGQRRAPTPDGRPGFIRIDSAHQGDQDGAKGPRVIDVAKQRSEFAKALNWEVHVHEGRFAEAYSRAGGKLVFSVGFLQRYRPNDAELAFVIGHEVAHALCEHERMNLSAVWRRNAPQRLQPRYAMEFLDTEPLLREMVAPAVRLQERVADRIGIELAASAGIDPYSALGFFDKSANEAQGGSVFLDMHDSAVERKTMLLQTAAPFQPLAALFRSPELSCSL